MCLFISHHFNRLLTFTRFDGDFLLVINGNHSTRQFRLVDFQNDGPCRSVYLEDNPRHENEWS